MVWTIPMVVAVGAALVAVPRISRRTVPLGVSVPHARTGELVVTRAVRTYQWACVALTVLTVLGSWATKAIEGSGGLWLLGLIVSGMGTFAVCRLPIVRAKRAGEWYEGVPVRIGAVLTEERTARPVWAAHTFSLSVAIVGIVIPWATLATLPDSSGQVVRWGDKSWGVAMTVPTITLVVAAGFAVLAWAITRRRDSILPDGDWAKARSLRDESSRVVQIALASFSVIGTLMTTSLGVTPLLRVSKTAADTALCAGSVALLVPIVWLIAATARAQTRGRAVTHLRADPDSPDDDALWKLGFIYYNTEDPSAFVPKRMGVGYEPNAGHPLGLLIYLIAPVAILVAVVVFVLG